MSAQQEKPGTFQPFGEYALPTEPTEDFLHRLFGHARQMLLQGDSEPAIADDKLHHSTRKDLDRLAAPPACGPLLNELQATFADWASDTDPADRTRLVVLPPGDENNLVETWAEQHGHVVVLAPARADLINNQLSQQAIDALPTFSGEGVLVIPKLERWFLRHRNGLTLLRELLRRIDEGDQRCLVSCNSWAWGYLSKAVNAEFVLPVGMTFQAFDASRLKNWFAELAINDDRDEIEFRLMQSGQNLFAESSNEAPTDETVIDRTMSAVRSIVRDTGKMESKEQTNNPHSYFVGLAARSFGIPWVAWHIWRRGLHSEAEVESDASDTDSSDTVDNQSNNSSAEVETLWVAALDEFSLPGSQSEQTLLVLHALLIHNELTIDELYLLLPATRDLNSIPALIRAGLVERRNNHLFCPPAAYPAIRSGLATAGFPLDRL